MEFGQIISGRQRTRDEKSGDISSRALSPAASPRALLDIPHQSPSLSIVRAPCSLSCTFISVLEGRGDSVGGVGVLYQETQLQEHLSMARSRRKDGNSSSCCQGSARRGRQAAAGHSNEQSGESVPRRIGMRGMRIASEAHNAGLAKALRRQGKLGRAVVPSPTISADIIGVPHGTTSQRPSGLSTPESTLQFPQTSARHRTRPAFLGIANLERFLDSQRSNPPYGPLHPQNLPGRPSPSATTGPAETRTRKPPLRRSKPCFPRAPSRPWKPWVNETFCSCALGPAARQRRLHPTRAVVE